MMETSEKPQGARWEQTHQNAEKTSDHFPQQSVTQNQPEGDAFDLHKRVRDGHVTLGQPDFREYQFE